MRDTHSDYFENSRNSIALHREYAARNPHDYVGYGRNFWGITAGEGPGNEVLHEDHRDRRFFGYTARGVPYGPDDGTLSPWAMLATLPFGAGPATRGNAPSPANLSAGLPPGPLLQRLQSDLHRRRRRLAVGRLVRAGSGPAGADDRELSLRLRLGPDAALSRRPRSASGVRASRADGFSHGRHGSEVDQVAPTSTNENCCSACGPTIGKIPRPSRCTTWSSSAAARQAWPRPNGRYASASGWRSSNDSGWAAIPSIPAPFPPRRSSARPASTRSCRAPRNLAPRRRMSCRWISRRSWRACGGSARGSPNIIRPIGCGPRASTSSSARAHFAASDALLVGDTTVALQEGAGRHGITAPALDHSGSRRGGLPHQRVGLRAGLPAQAPGHHRRRPAGLRSGANLLAAGHACDPRAGRAEIPAPRRTGCLAASVVFAGARRRRHTAQHRHPGRPRGERRQDTGYGQ